MYEKQLAIPTFFMTSFNPNSPDPVKVVPFGTMRNSLSDIDLTNIHEYNLNMTCILVLFVCF